MARVPFDPATDYYQLLGVGPRASTEEIQAAYRRLAKEYHPDLNAGSAVAAARMARVNAAKSVLLDRESRAIYDGLRAGRPTGPVQDRVVPTPTPGQVTVRYAPHQAGPRPRYRVVSHDVRRSATRPGFDRGTGILLVFAVPLIVALALYVFEAFQLSIQPLRPAPSDTNLSAGPSARPTARGVADAVFMMVHTQPPSRELAMRANNFILARADSTPESELLQADGRRLVRAATVGDTDGWDAAVADICDLAGRC